MDTTSIVQKIKSGLRREVEFRRMQKVQGNSGRRFSVATLPRADNRPDLARIQSLREATVKGKKMWEGIKLSFNEQTHVRQKPIAFFELQIELMKYVAGKTMVEIGSARARIPHLITEFNPVCCNDGHSTYHWASASIFDVHTVDISPESKVILDKVGFPTLKAYAGDGVGFLRDWSGPSIDFLFLDAWDVGVPQYAEKHLEAFEVVKSKLSARHIIGIDDTDFVGDGKGKLLVPHLLSLGYRMLADGRQTVFTNFALT